MIDFSPEDENRIEFRSMTTPLTCFKYRSPSSAGLRCLAEGSLIPSSHLPPCYP